MARHSEIKAYAEVLQDIQSIIKTIKNITLSELNKAGKGLVWQRKRIDSIQEVIDDYFSFYPFTMPIAEQKRRVYVMIGSERGFCGGFNHLIADKCVKLRSEKGQQDENIFIGIGSKMISKFEHFNFSYTLNGAEAFEDIPMVIGRLLEIMEQLLNLYPDLSPFNWNILFNTNNNENRILETKHYIPFESLNSQHPTLYPYEPLLNMSPNDLFPKLLNYFLAGTYYTLFYESFLAENIERLNHLTGALNILDKRSFELKRKLNKMVRDDITEEISVIISSILQAFRREE